jgi:hypothetical protein
MHMDVPGSLHRVRQPAFAAADPAEFLHLSRRPQRAAG